MRDPKNKKIVIKSLALMLYACSCLLYCKHAEKQIKNKIVENAVEAVNAEPKEPKENELFLIDTAKAVVFSQERTDVITLSDVQRPTLDGTNQTLDDLVLAKLITQDASHYKMEPDDDAVDKHLKAVQRENNLSLDELKGIFSSAGYTYEEGREQFKMMTAINSMVDFRIRSRLVVPEREIEAYYQAHPIVQEAAYQVEHAVVAVPDGMDQAGFLQEINKLIKTGQTKLDIDWGEPFWINKSEIAKDKQFLTTMEVGNIGMGSESASGIELFKLRNKKEEHLLSLEERYNEIAEFLKRPKYNELFEQYKKDLLTGAALIYL
jgi:parvulin-like peptidyl-prolyl isomerase